MGNEARKYGKENGRKKRKEGKRESNLKWWVGGNKEREKKLVVLG